MYRMAKGLRQLCVFYLFFFFKKHKQIQSAEGGELESKFCFDNKKCQQTLFWQRVGTQQRSSDSEQRQESPCYTSQLNSSESQAQRVKRVLRFFLFFFFTPSYWKAPKLSANSQRRFPRQTTRAAVKTEKTGGRLQSRAACGQVGNLPQPFTHPH